MWSNTFVSRLLKHFGSAKADGCWNEFIFFFFFLNFLLRIIEHCSVFGTIFPYTCGKSGVAGKILLGCGFQKTWRKSLQVEASCHVRCLAVLNSKMSFAGHYSDPATDLHAHFSLCSSLLHRDVTNTSSTETGSSSANKSCPTPSLQSMEVSSRPADLCARQLVCCGQNVSHVWCLLSVQRLWPWRVWLWTVWGRRRRPTTWWDEACAMTSGATSVSFHLWTSRGFSCCHFKLSAVFFEKCVWVRVCERDVVLSSFSITVSTFSPREWNLCTVQQINTISTLKSTYLCTHRTLFVWSLLKYTSYFCSFISENSHHSV